MDPFLAFLPEGSHLGVRKSQAIPVSFRKDVLGKPHDDQDFQKLLVVGFFSFFFFYFSFYFFGAGGGAVLCPQLETVYMPLNVQKPLCVQKLQSTWSVGRGIKKKPRSSSRSFKTQASV